MEKINNQHSEFIYAVRERNKSLKMYKNEEGKYLIFEKFYLINICYKKKTHTFNMFDEAEDFLIQNTRGVWHLNIPHKS